MSSRAMTAFPGTSTPHLGNVSFPPHPRANAALPALAPTPVIIPPENQFGNAAFSHVCPRKRAARVPSQGSDGRGELEQEAMVAPTGPFEAGERGGAKQGGGKAPDGLKDKKTDR